jgi:hypothetical protein
VLASLYGALQWDTNPPAPSDPGLPGCLSSRGHGLRAARTPRLCEYRAGSIGKRSGRRAARLRRDHSASSTLACIQGSARSSLLPASLPLWRQPPSALLAGLTMSRPQLSACRSAIDCPSTVTGARRVGSLEGPAKPLLYAGHGEDTPCKASGVELAEVVPAALIGAYGRMPAGARCMARTRASLCWTSGTDELRAALRIGPSCWRNDSPGAAGGSRSHHSGDLDRTSVQLGCPLSGVAQGETSAASAASGARAA